MTTAQAISTQLDEAVPLLEQLSAVLKAEQQALVSQKIDELDSLVRDKLLLLEKLAILEPHILSAMNDDSNSAENSQLAGVAVLLESCRQLNQENNALVVQGIKNIDHSISFLHQVTQTGTVGLYDPSGKTGNQSAKRNLGQA